mmetsp:Transcript_22492/g.60317  ORF Transcript_22492/g.60317 Transcript_22492/m.60317 type:complete len:237 (+) Transcript_22492:39-749(+)
MIRSTITPASLSRRGAASPSSQSQRPWAWTTTRNGRSQVQEKCAQLPPSNSRPRAPRAAPAGPPHEHGLDCRSTRSGRRRRSCIDMLHAFINETTDILNEAIHSHLRRDGRQITRGEWAEAEDPPARSDAALRPGEAHASAVRAHGGKGPRPCAAHAHQPGRDVRRCGRGETRRRADARGDVRALRSRQGRLILREGVAHVPCARGAVDLHAPERHEIVGHHARPMGMTLSTACRS